MKLRNAEKRLLIAVSQIIENEGFSKIGVNKIAKQAKCDKVLIYRYFGGLEGLLAAWAKDNDFYTLAYQAYSERVTKAESSEDLTDKQANAGIVSMGVIGKFYIQKYSG